MNRAEQSKARKFPERKSKYKTIAVRLFYQELINKGKTFEEFVKTFEFSPSSVLDRLEYKVIGYRKGRTQEITNKLLNIMRRETPIAFEYYKYFQYTDGIEPELIEEKAIKTGNKDFHKRIEEIKALLDRLNPDDILAIDVKIVKRPNTRESIKAEKVAKIKEMVRKASITRKSRVLRALEGYEDIIKVMEEEFKEFSKIKLAPEEVEEALRELEPELDKDIREYWRRHF